MDFVMDRKPTFYTGSAFLNSWTINRPLYCVGVYEVYKIRGDSDLVFGLVIRCKKREEALEQSKLHLSWWQLQGKDRIKVLANDIRNQGAWHLFLAAIVIPQNIITLEELKSFSLTQIQAESLASDLIALCRLAHTHHINPVIQVGAVLMVKVSESIISTSLFVKKSELTTEAETIESIAKVVYLLTTGIDTAQSDPSKKTTLPPANHWNKNINQQFSLLLGSCLDKKNSNRITSLSTLETQLRRFSKSAVITKPDISSNDQESKDTVKLQSSIGLSKVAGMIELKALLMEEVVQPIRNPEPFKQYGIPIPNGMLLYGPPGCGKTYIARQLAEELGWYFKEVKGSDVGSIYIHGTVLAIGALFAEAEEHPPAMIFIDEFEGLVPKRSGLHEHQQHTSAEVNEFLVNLNECATKGIFIVAATNEPSKIDDAVKRPGRLDKMIYVGPPDFEARIELLKMYLTNRPLAELDFRKFAELLDGYSCSDIHNITNESARLALKAGKPINSEHLSEAIRRNPSSLSPELISKYKDFQQRGI